MYTDCRDGVTQIQDAMEGGGYEWPMNTQSAINTSVEAWNFFKQYSLEDSSTEIESLRISNRSINLSARFINDFAVLNQAGLNGEAHIYSLGGGLLSAQKLRSGRISMKNFSSGVYHLLVISYGKNELVKVFVI